jgi:hypothetical protein
VCGAAAEITLWTVRTWLQEQRVTMNLRHSKHCYTSYFRACGWYYQIVEGQ